MVSILCISWRSNCISRIQKNVSDLTLPTLYGKDLPIELVIATHFDENMFDLLIKALKNKNIPVRIIQRFSSTEKIGTTRNTLWSEAKYPYMMYLDDDDICFPHRLSYQLKFLMENEGMKATCSERCIVYDTKNDVSWKNVKSVGECCLFMHRTFPKRFRDSSVFEAKGFEDEPTFKHSTDTELMLLVQHGGNITKRGLPNGSKKYKRWTDLWKTYLDIM